jgi:hypothetical protein
VLQIDQAGWHGPEKLAVPDGIRLVFQPACSPELQPAEHLWEFVDEPLANRCFDTIEDLDNAVSERCVALVEQRDMIRDRTLFHWWPRLREVAASAREEVISRRRYDWREALRGCAFAPLRPIPSRRKSYGGRTVLIR